MRRHYEKDHEKEAAYWGELAAFVVARGPDVPGQSAANRAGMMAQEAAHEAFLARPDLRETAE